MNALSEPGFRGLDEARQALAAGRAAILPNPSPQSYGIVATNPHVVNAAKGRPPDQEVGVLLHDQGEWLDLVPSLDLGPVAVAKAHALMRVERVTILAPLRPGSPPPVWVEPGVRDGHVLFFGADLSLFGIGWAPLAAVWAQFPRLYGSSANRTGQSAATTAAEARIMFSSDVPVVDGDALLDLDHPHAATTMLRIATDGSLTLARRGAQDAAFGRGPQAYLERLAAYEAD